MFATFVIFFGGALFAFSLLFCSLFYLLEGNWPIWHFRLFAAWWWPFKKASAATMLADTMIGMMHKDWRASGYKDWVNPKLHAKFSTFCDSIKAEVNGDKVPLNQWDRYRIVEAIKRFEKGRVGRAKEDSAQKTAEAIIKAYGGNA